MQSSLIASGHPFHAAQMEAGCGSGRAVGRLDAMFKPPLNRIAALSTFRLRGSPGPIGILFACVLAALLAAAAAMPARAAEAVLTLDAGTHTAAIRQLAIDADERLLLTASDDKTARLWDIASGRLLHTLHPPIGPDNLGRLYAAAISPAGRLALAGTTAASGGPHRIYLYDMKDMSLIKAIDARGGDIKRLQWSPDGTLLAAAYAGSAAFRVFDDNGRLLHEERLPADAWSVSLSNNGLLALPVSDGTVRVYGIAGRVRLLATLRAGLPDPRGVQFSPDGKLLAVGYQSRRSAREVQVDVFDVMEQTLARSFVFDDVAHGNLRNVAWQRDGSALYAAGSGYRAGNAFLIKRIAWPEGTVATTTAAGNSITDLLPLTDGRVLFATVEPSWGVLRGTQARIVVAPKSAQFLDAAALTVSPDARTVAWRFAPGEARFSFSLDTRDLARGERGATRQARTESSRIPVRGWENSYDVSVAGRAVPMAPTEIARAVAMLPDDAGVLLATSRSLRRIDAGGREVWRVPLPTEARAINVSSDGMLLVAALADGTLRWRHTRDGAPLLSLFATRDGQWLLWDEHGYFDASPGAEHLAGWTVNRADGVQADYFPMARFQDRFFRPELVGRAMAQPVLAGQAAPPPAPAQSSQAAQAAQAAQTFQASQATDPSPAVLQGSGGNSPGSNGGAAAGSR